MIRFSAVLVAVAAALLVAGIISSDLKLVYVAIGVSSVALLALAIGWYTSRDKLSGVAPQPLSEPSLSEPSFAAENVAQAVPAATSVPVGAATGGGAAQGAAAGVAAAGVGEAPWGRVAASPEEAATSAWPSAPASEASWSGTGWGDAQETASLPSSASLPEAGRFDTGFTGYGSAAQPASYMPPAPERVAPEPAVPEPVAPEPFAPEPFMPEVASFVPEPFASESFAAESFAAEAGAGRSAGSGGGMDAPTEISPSMTGTEDAVTPTEAEQQEAEPVPAEPVALEPVAAESVAPEPVGPEPVGSESVVPVLAGAGDAELAGGEDTTSASAEGDGVDTSAEVVADDMVEHTANDTSGLVDNVFAPADEVIEPAGDVTEPADDVLDGVAEQTTLDDADPVDGSSPAESSEDAPDPSREVTVVPGVPRYHDVGCILIRFMGEGDLEKTTLGAAAANGCTPCRACLAD